MLAYAVLSIWRHHRISVLKRKIKREEQNVEILLNCFENHTNHNRPITLDTSEDDAASTTEGDSND